MKQLLFIVSIICVVMPIYLLAQGTPDNSTPPAASVSTSSAPRPNVLVAMDDDYRIGVNDVIEVQIEDAPELSGSFRIAKSGTFLLPFLGRVTAHKKTTEELAQSITDGLRDRYLSDPHVKVAVRQYNSRSFFIQGSVRNPGVYQVEGKPSLLVLLTLAGGLVENHSSSAFILRPNKQSLGNPQTVTVLNEEPQKDGPQKQNAAAQAATDEYTLLKVNIHGLLQGRFEQNMYLEPGDIVNIPPGEVFFVAGEVFAPGSFQLKEGTTLRQAIALAQGTNFKADRSRSVIFRDDPTTGKKREIPIDVSAVMSGKSEDIVIEANDIITIPNSRMKSVAAPLLSAFGMSVVRVPLRY